MSPEEGKDICPQGRGRKGRVGFALLELLCQVRRVCSPPKMLVCVLYALGMIFQDFEYQIVPYRH